MGAVAVTVTLAACSLGLALRDPLTSGGPTSAYLDTLAEPTLPTWWSTTLLVTVAIAYVAAGVSARVANTSDGAAWFVGAAVVGNEGTGFALTYHVEEQGEDLGALLLLGAATSALSLTHGDSAVALRYACTGPRC